MPEHGQNVPLVGFFACVALTIDRLLLLVQPLAQPDRPHASRDRKAATWIQVGPLSAGRSVKRDVA